MKKSLFIFLIFLLTACRETLTTYSNSYYQFSLEFPESYTYCLNELCYNDLPEDAIASFALKDEFGGLLIYIQPFKNLLEMSAVEFGARSLELNRQWSEQWQDSYFQEEESALDVEAAFTFLAELAFEERGGTYTTDEKGYIALEENQTTPEETTVSFLLNEPYRVIYTQHGDHIFRILHTLDEETLKVMGSFQFLE